MRPVRRLAPRGAPPSCHGTRRPVAVRVGASGASAAAVRCAGRFPIPAWTSRKLSGWMCLVAAFPAVVLIYGIKSKLGINLLPEPSPLHGLFVLMRGAGLV